MARVVILSIPDNDVAVRFARSVLDAERNGMPFVPTDAKIEAMIAQPTRGCRCVGRRKSTKGWSRTPRFGWWVHPECKRPAASVVSNFIRDMMHGCMNLMTEVDPERDWPQPRIVEYQKRIA